MFWDVQIFQKFAKFKILRLSHYNDEGNYNNYYFIDNHHNNDVKIVVLDTQ